MDNKQKEDAIVKLIYKHSVFNESGIKEIYISDLRQKIDALYDLTCHDCKYNEGGGCNRLYCYRSGHTYPDNYEEADK